jgi:hypothetical protein
MGENGRIYIKGRVIRRCVALLRLDRSETYSLHLQLQDFLYGAAEIFVFQQAGMVEGYAALAVEQN